MGKYHGLNTPNLDILHSVNNLSEIFDALVNWNVYKPYPLDIYLCILNNKNIAREIILSYQLKHLSRFLYMEPTEFAVANGNIELLIYLHENNYILTERTFGHALQNKNINMVMWLIDKKCPRGILLGFAEKK